MAIKKSITDVRLYVLTGEQFHPGKNMLDVMESALAGGAGMIQLREKTCSKRQLLHRAKQLKVLCDSYDVPFIVNDHLDVALAVDADGVHLGQDDLPLPEARKILGANKLIGISTHSLEEARQAEKDGADYIGVGPVYATQTKEDVVDPVGLQYVQQVRENISIPFVAIGGIKVHNVQPVLEAGARTICVVSAVVGADDPQQAAQDLRTIINQYE